jgi:hypothetical protein
MLEGRLDGKVSSLPALQTNAQHCSGGPYGALQAKIPFASIPDLSRS